MSSKEPADVLKDEMGLEGFVVSDANAILEAWHLGIRLGDAATASLVRPVKELKDYCRKCLNAGEKRESRLFF